MTVIVASLQGRFGNQTMQWLFTYAFAQQHGMEFQCGEWIGERIFVLPEYKRPDAWRVGHRALPRVNEITIFERDPERHDPQLPFFREREFRGYAQQQRTMIYTKRQAQRWLRLRPEIETACANAASADNAVSDRIVCHRRVGDFLGYGYPVVTLSSYAAACEQFGLLWDSPSVAILSEEDPTPHGDLLPDELSFMPDFFRMMVAPTLLRANSTFSWLAALLGNGLVLSPVIDGLEGGKEHHCNFVAGNHPRLANFDFTTDLYVSQ